jgi:Cu-Zn family superoxide dismutase
MRRVILSVASLAALIGCSTDDSVDVEAADPMAADTTTVAAAAPTPETAETARAVLRNAAGAEVGTAMLMQDGNGVRIEYRLTSLEAGERAFHLHEAGSCEAPTFESAGGHFNPTGRSHGLEHPQGPHAGDMPNLEVGDDGAVEGSVTNDRVTLLANQPNSVFDSDGTALVVHAGADDQQSQPSGNAGDRVACGVIEPA